MQTSCLDRPLGDDDGVAADRPRNDLSSLDSDPDPHHARPPNQGENVGGGRGGRGAAVARQKTRRAPPAPKAAANLVGSGRQRAIAARPATGTKVNGMPADHLFGRISPSRSTSPGARPSPA